MFVAQKIKKSKATSDTLQEEHFDSIYFVDTTFHANDLNCSDSDGCRIGAVQSSDFSDYSSDSDAENMGRDHNRYFENEGRKRQDRAQVPPTRFPCGRGAVWICGQDDITVQFLRSFSQPPVVITCKDGPVPSVVKACEKAGCPIPNRIPYLFNVGYFRGGYDELFTS